MTVEKFNQTFSPGHLLSEKVIRIPHSYTIENSYENINIYNRILRITTWTGRSLFVTGKLANFGVEMTIMNIDIRRLIGKTNKDKERLYLIN